MPLVPSSYHTTAFFRNGHLATIYNGLFRKVTGIAQKRERIILSDGDFLDLDWSYAANSLQHLVVLLHGLEGDAQRPYITGSAKLFNSKGFDACAINYRGCSGEPNTKYRSYHSGATEDLKEVLDHIIATKNYENIYLKGFSLGGNLTLKYHQSNHRSQAKLKSLKTSRRLILFAHESTNSKCCSTACALATTTLIPM